MSSWFVEGEAKETIYLDKEAPVSDWNGLGSVVWLQREEHISENLDMNPHDYSLRTFPGAQGQYIR